MSMAFLYDQLYIRSWYEYRATHVHGVATKADHVHHIMYISSTFGVVPSYIRSSTLSTFILSAQHSQLYAELSAELSTRRSTYIPLHLYLYVCCLIFTCLHLSCLHLLLCIRRSAFIPLHSYLYTHTFTCVAS